MFEPQFERMNSLNPPSFDSLKAPVVWNGDVYALGRDRNDKGKLFKYSLSKNEWSQISIDHPIYVSGCVLTTYHSKLLLISGEDTMTIWEFINNEFKPSCIEPVPSTFPKLKKANVFTISTDKDLIIVSWNRSWYLDFVQFIYDGREWRVRKCCDWKTREHYENDSVGKHRGESTEFLTDGYEIFWIISKYGRVTSIWKVSIRSSHSFSLQWKRCDIISCQRSVHKWEHYSLGHTHGRKDYFKILHNQQFYFIDRQGKIITAFIQSSTIVSIIWGKSNVYFLDTPYLVGLPDGTMLMIGKHGPQTDPEFELIIPQGGPGTELDVIKVSHKGITLISRVFNMDALCACLGHSQCGFSNHQHMHHT